MVEVMFLIESHAGAPVAERIEKSRNAVKDTLVVQGHDDNKPGRGAERV